MAAASVGGLSGLPTAAQTRLRQAVEAKVLSAFDLDLRALKELAAFPEQAQLSLLDRFLGSLGKTSVRNKSAFLIGIINRYKCLLPAPPAPGGASVPLPAAAVPSPSLPHAEGQQDSSPQPNPGSSSSTSSSSSSSSSASSASSASFTIYVGNISEAVTERILFDVFAPFGPIQNVRKVEHKYAFVDFVSPASAQRAVSISGVSLMGRMIRVEVAQTTRSTARPTPQPPRLPITSIQRGGFVGSALGASKPPRGRSPTRRRSHSGSPSSSSSPSSRSSSTSSSSSLSLSSRSPSRHRHRHRRRQSPRSPPPRSSPSPSPRRGRCRTRRSRSRSHSHSPRHGHGRRRRSSSSSSPSRSPSPSPSVRSTSSHRRPSRHHRRHSRSPSSLSRSRSRSRSPPRHRGGRGKARRSKASSRSPSSASSRSSMSSSSDSSGNDSEQEEEEEEEEVETLRRPRKEARRSVEAAPRPGPSIACKKASHEESSPPLPARRLSPEAAPEAQQVEDEEEKEQEKQAPVPVPPSAPHSSGPGGSVTPTELSGPLAGGCGPRASASCAAAATAKTVSLAPSSSSSRSLSPAASPTSSSSSSASTPPAPLSGLADVCFPWLAGDALVQAERDKYRAWRLRMGRRVPFSAEVWNSQLHKKAFDLLETERRQEAKEATAGKEPVREERVENFDDSFMCPVCYEIMDEPHALKSCDHIFCKACLDTMATKTSLRSCPLCRESNPLTSAYNTPMSILNAYIRKTYKWAPSETEKRALFDQLIPRAERSKVLAYRQAYQTWRRKHFFGAKGEFSDVVQHFARTPCRRPMRLLNLTTAAASPLPASPPSSPQSFLLCSSNQEPKWEENASADRGIESNRNI